MDLSLDRTSGGNLGCWIVICGTGRATSIMAATSGSQVASKVGYAALGPARWQQLFSEV